MKQILLKLLKLILIVTAVVLGLLIVFGLALMAGWPWWVGFFLLVGIGGMLIAVLFARKLWLKRREQHFVNQVIEQDDQFLSQMGSKDKEVHQELQQRWKEAVQALKQSHLKKQGNPLYVLPWYMIIGESGSGKTTAIQSARLSSPFAEIKRISGISGTRNCDWWFFEQAILIDTAGRYAIPIDEGRDKDEWQRFLALLTKYRRKEPLNGLVVTVAADKLAESGTEALEDDGKNIRRRIDELMRVLGAKFPVYLLVTKCDLVQGMNAFCNFLPESSLNQAMGHVNHEQSADADAFLKRALHTVAERLRNLRLLLFQKSSGQTGAGNASLEADPGLLLFPEEFERIQPGLAAFVRSAFEENPYQETPMFRGVFFSSGRQEGAPYSHFLQALGLIGQRDVLPGTSKGLFLHDFFSKILPRDRELFAPTQRAMTWSRLTRNLGLTAWVALGVAVCGLLSYAFVKNLWTLRDISREFSSPPVMQGELLTDLTILERYRQAIESVSRKNEHWWVPRFGLDQSREVEIRLKADFCDRFGEYLIKDLDRRIAGAVAAFDGNTPDELMSIYVPHLVRRANLLAERLRGSDLEALRRMPQPTFEVAAPILQRVNVPAEVEDRFESLYLFYLIWQPEDTELNRELNNLQTWLGHLFKQEAIDLKWLTAWANRTMSQQAVDLTDFWGGGEPPPESVSVPAAFSLDGRRQIDAMLVELETSLQESLILAPKKEAFARWYRKQYLDAWERFAGGFGQGTALLEDREAYRRMAGRMPTDQGPYFQFLERMSDEIQPMVESGDPKELPGWVAFLSGLQNARAQAAGEAAAEKSGILAKTTQKGKQLIGKLEQKTGMKDPGQGLLLELEAGKAFHEYRSALARMVPNTVTQQASFAAATDIFQQNPATGQSDYFKARSALNRLQAALPSQGSEPKLIADLLAGPLEFVAGFMCRETACELQQLWEREVLVEIQGVSDQLSLNQFLFGEDGYAVRFVRGPADPFVNRSLSKGYYAKNVSGLMVPFEKAFLSFMSRGARTAKPMQSSYAVTLVGRPTNANPEARIQPHATRLTLQCAEKTQEIINRNYPVRQTFRWSPQNCGDVEFQIEIGNMVLTRSYRGYQAFARFLQDFSQGQKTFRPADFPADQAALERLGVAFIQVTYQIDGHEPILSILNAAPGSVPSKIAQCWDR
ncbi:MAG TPA: type VI secretion protein IcmF/TssM N-terminal domain-containing protein [Desulfobacterales bacterium]